MIRCLMVGGGFQHQESISINFKKSENFLWVKGNEEHDIKMFIDSSIFQNLGKDKKNNFAWIFESESIFNTKELLNKIDLLSDSYELIFTHNEKFLRYGSNFVFVPANSFWIKSPKLYDKTKLVSFITSNKNYTEGHQKRLMTLKNIPNYIDVYGFSIKPIKDKEEGLCDYMYSIVIENGKYNSYFTEKILDCFSTGTIPIYWGCEDIDKHFDSNGIIKFTDNFDFSILSKEYYYSKLDSIKNNLELVKKYEVVEQFIYDKYLINRNTL